MGLQIFGLSFTRHFRTGLFLGHPDGVFGSAVNVNPNKFQITSTK